LVVELEHLKTKTRLKDEKFASVKGECETLMIFYFIMNHTIDDPSMLRLIRKTADLARIFPTLD
jgi:hypothetical protein